MKTTAQIEVHKCDTCGMVSEPVFTCIRCGIEHCYTCRKTEGVEYAVGVHASGSGDGYYCKECDDALTTSGTDKKHTAYRAIAALRREERAWGVEFERRRKAAEKQLESLSR